MPAENNYAAIAATPAASRRFVGFAFQIQTLR
jgi:hypothetical protein